MWASQLGLVSGEQVHRGLSFVGRSRPVVGRGLAAITTRAVGVGGRRGWMADMI